MATTRQTPFRITNKGLSEWQVDQSLAFAKESIDSRFCPGYAMKNPNLVGILVKAQMELERYLDRQDSKSCDKTDIEMEVLNNMCKWEMTYSILQSHFPNSLFTASEAFDVIRPIRTKISKFKDEKSFRGTILAELQTLEKRNILEFVPDMRGTYRFL